MTVIMDQGNYVIKFGNDVDFWNNYQEIMDQINGEELEKKV